MLESGPARASAGARRRRRARRGRDPRPGALARRRAGAERPAPRRLRSRRPRRLSRARAGTPLDDLVARRAARGLVRAALALDAGPRVGVALRRPVRRRSVCRPRPARSTARSCARSGARYDGTYAERTRAAGLPRVERWSLGNEPNQPAGCAAARPPARRHVPAAAVALPRAWRGAGIAALRATGHRGDQILLGRDQPDRARPPGRSRRPAVPPARSSARCCASTRAAARCAAARPACSGCRRFARLRVTGFAHHPYTQGGSRPPGYRGKPATEITLASAGRLERLLDAGARRGRIPARLPDPLHRARLPDQPARPTFGVSPARQAEYINQSDWIAYRDPRVQTVAQYKLARRPGRSRASSPGLRFWDGRPSRPTTPTGCRCG